MFRALAVFLLLVCSVTAEVRIKEKASSKARLQPIYTRPHFVQEEASSTPNERAELGGLEGEPFPVQERKFERESLPQQEYPQDNANSGIPEEEQPENPFRSAEEVDKEEEMRRLRDESRLPPIEEGNEQEEEVPEGGGLGGLEGLGDEGEASFPLDEGNEGEGDVVPEGPEGPEGGPTPNEFVVQTLAEGFHFEEFIVEAEPSKNPVSTPEDEQLDATAAAVADQLLTVTEEGFLWSKVSEGGFALSGEFSHCEDAVCGGEVPPQELVALETGASTVRSRLKKQIINNPPTWAHVLIHTFPHSTIGRLSMGCTGTLIAPRVVVTAAHCLVDDTDPLNLKVQPARTVKFAPIQDGVNHQPYGEKTAKRLFVPRGYIATNGAREDWGYVVLESAFAMNLGYLGFAKYDGPAVLPIRIAGYPMSKNREMWESECTMTFVRSGQISHRCDTEPGNSGSTIRERIGGDALVIRAIHDGALGADNYGYPIQTDAFRQFRLARAVNRLDHLPANHQEAPDIIDNMRLIYSSIFG